MKRTRNSQQGFTLIELVVVIVILGILAAFAIPRFVNINTEARVAALQGLSGSLRSSAALLHGLALARNLPGGAGTLTLEGQAVTIANFYPTADAAGIEASLSNLDGFVSAAGGGGWQFETKSSPASAATCNVTYKAATATTGAEVILTVTDCS